jgi:hypothetical protein
MKYLEWLTKKPKFTEPCILICACKIGKGKRAYWEYEMFQVLRIDYDEKWYWGWCDGEGQEIGDLADLVSDKYFLIPLLK